MQIVDCEALAREVRAGLDTSRDQGMPIKPELMIVEVVRQHDIRRRTTAQLVARRVRELLFEDSLARAAARGTEEKETREDAPRNQIMSGYIPASYWRSSSRGVSPRRVDTPFQRDLRRSNQLLAEQETRDLAS